MRSQNVTTTFVCEQCGKEETLNASKTYTPPDWVYDAKLHLDGRYIGRICWDVCSLGCFTAAFEEFIDGERAQGNL